MFIGCVNVVAVPVLLTFLEQNTPLREACRVVARGCRVEKRAARGRRPACNLRAPPSDQAATIID